jgi:hypothetical protein
VPREDTRSALGSPLGLDRCKRVGELRKERFSLAVNGVPRREQSRRVGEMLVGKRDCFDAGHGT